MYFENITNIEKHNREFKFMGIIIFGPIYTIIACKKRG